MSPSRDPALSPALAARFRGAFDPWEITGGLWLLRRSLAVPAAGHQIAGQDDFGFPAHAGNGARQLGPAERQAEAESSSPATFLTRLGSTGTPGPIVVERVTFLM